LVEPVVVVAEHRNDRHAEVRHLARDDVCLVGIAVVGQIPGDQKRVGDLGQRL